MEVTPALSPSRYPSPLPQKSWHMHNVRMPPEQIERLREVADRERRSIAETIRIAIEQYLDRADEGEKT